MVAIQNMPLLVNGRRLPLESERPWTAALSGDIGSSLFERRVVPEVSRAIVQRVGKFLPKDFLPSCIFQAPVAGSAVASTTTSLIRRCIIDRRQSSDPLAHPRAALPMLGWAQFGAARPELCTGTNIHVNSLCCSALGVQEREGGAIPELWRYVSLPDFERSS